MSRHRRALPPGPTCTGVGFVILLVAAAVSCGRPGPSQQQAATPAAVQPKAASVTAELFPSGTCSVTISGALQLSFNADPTPSSFHTDYWYSEAKLRGLLAAEAADDEDVGEQDEAWHVDQRMSQNPVYTPLLITCIGRGVSVALAPGARSEYADVPFAPHAYEVSPGTGPEDAIRGHFWASVHVNQGGILSKFVVSKPGVLAVIEFDHDHIAGTFSFVAIGAGKNEISVQGRFAYRRPVAK